MFAKTSIIAGLASVRKELSEIYPHLNDDMLDWAPAKGMRTIHGQFVEIAATEKGIVDVLNGGDRQPQKEIEKELWACTTLGDLLNAIGDIRLDTLEFIVKLDEAQLSADAGLSPGFSKWLELEVVTVEEALRFLVRHESYHCGQLFSYLWAKGNDPYQWPDHAE